AAYGTLPTATRTGYTFKGWFTSATGGTEVTAATVVRTASAHTLYAQWTANKYNVTFNGTGGTLSAATKEVTFATAYGTLPTATRTGYTFDGWFTAATGGTKVTAATLVSTTSAHTLYAQWTARQYTVTYRANGGKGTAPAGEKAAYNTSYTPKANPFSRTDYIFTGWNTKADGSGTAYTAGKAFTWKHTSGITLYAQWKTKGYTVTFDAGSGKIGTAQKVTKKEINGTKYVLPAAPVRKAYTFMGWYTKTAGGTQITKNTTVKLTKAQTLYARWKVKMTAVYCLYNPNSGEHFFTIAPEERDRVVAAGWKYEGIAWMAAMDGTPVFRLYNLKSGEHLYTMDTRERDRLLVIGWKYEGIGFYSNSEHSKAIFRMYNPNAPEVAQHHYTVNEKERDHLVKEGWKYEGLAWYPA
ncbi:MAG: InlB B-repeat-containing protein, partial [Lachnospiraceae bacterium]